MSRPDHALPVCAAACTAEQREQLVGALWREVLQCPSLESSAHFYRVGGDDALAAELLDRIETRFATRLTLGAFQVDPTIGGVARRLAPPFRHVDLRQIVRHNRSGARAPLILIHSLGAHYRLAAHLGEQQPVVGLQAFDPRIRWPRRPGTLQELAGAYLNLVLSVVPHGPFSLVGVGAAGALAFEMARQLRSQHRAPWCVFLLASWPPQHLERLSWPRRPLSRVALGTLRMRGEWRQWRRAGFSSLQFLKSSRQVHKLYEFLGREPPPDPRPSLAPPDLVAHERRLHAYLTRLTERYEPSAYAGHVALCRPLEEPAHWGFDPYAPWYRWCRSLELHALPGDAHTVLEEPAVTGLARVIEQCLRERRAHGEDESLRPDPDRRSRPLAARAWRALRRLP